MSRIRVNSIKPISGTIVSVSGSLIVTGDVTAEQFITEKVHTSVIYKSGSTLFGDTPDDKHEFTGSMFVSGGIDSNKSITLGDDVNIQKGINGGGLLEVLPTDTEGLHGLQLAAETTSSNVNYTTFYNNKFSISEAGRAGVVGSNGEHIKLEDYYKVESGIPTRYAGIQINHPSSSRFKLGADLSAEADYPFYVNADSKFNGDVIITGNLTAEQYTTTVVSSSVIYQSGSTKFGDTSDDKHQFTGSIDLTGQLSIGGYNNVSASIAHLDHFSSSFDNIYASEVELYTATASLDARIISLESFSSSIDSEYATDAQLEAVSSSLALETAQLLGFSASLDATYATDAQLETVSASFATLTTANQDDISTLQTDVNNNNDDIAALSGSQLGLLAATSSYALKSDITGSFTLLSASIAQSITDNHNDIHDLEQDAYTFVPSASIELYYVSKAKLRAALTGSTNYNDFTGSLLALLA